MSRLRVAAGRFSPRPIPAEMIRGWHQEWAPCWGRQAIAIASHGARSASVAGEIRR